MKPTGNNNLFNAALPSALGRKSTPSPAGPSTGLISRTRPTFPLPDLGRSRLRPHTPGPAHPRRPKLLARPPTPSRVQTPRMPQQDRRACRCRLVSPNRTAHRDLRHSQPRPVWGRMCRRGREPIEREEVEAINGSAVVCPIRAGEARSSSVLSRPGASHLALNMREPALPSKTQAVYTRLERPHRPTPVPNRQEERLGRASTWTR